MTDEALLSIVRLLPDESYSKFTAQKASDIQDIKGDAIKLQCNPAGEFFTYEF